MFSYIILIAIYVFTNEVYCFDRRIDNFRIGLQQPPIQRQSVNPTKALGGSCAKNSECLTAYAVCQQKVCRCRPGFQPDAQSGCSPRKVSCPIGAPLMQANGQPTTCTLSRQSNPNGGGFLIVVGRKRRQVDAIMPPLPPYDQVKDSCSGDYFCMSHTIMMFSDVQEGHCCPKPKPECPVGQPDTRYSCNTPFIPPSNSGGRQPQNTKPQCPYESHYCSSFGGAWSPSLHDSAVCCPKACPEMTVLKNGVCYGHKKLGEACKVNEQCFGTQGTCQNGKCTCKPGQISNRNSNFCMVPHCPPTPGSSQQKQTALRLPNGSFRRCQRDAQCGAKAICMGKSFCCPQPKPYCPDNPGTPVASSRTCNPFRRQTTGSRCPQGKFCFNFSLGSSQRKGICCSQPLPLPRNSLAAANGQSSPIGISPQIQQ